MFLKKINNKNDIKRIRPNKEILGKPITLFFIMLNNILNIINITNIIRGDITSEKILITIQYENTHVKKNIIDILFFFILNFSVCNSLSIFF